MNNETKIAALRHYASPYYDPVKAHEYYMRNRQLKGRRSLTTLSDEGKKVWSYTKNSIKDEKNKKIKDAVAKRNAEIKKLRAKASVVQKDISKKLKHLNDILRNEGADSKKNIEKIKKSKFDEISKESSTKREQIDNATKKAIKSLLDEEIPEGLSKSEKAELIAERKEKIAELRNKAKSDKISVRNDAGKRKNDIKNEASKDKSLISDKIKKTSMNNRLDVKKKKEQASLELKTAITAAKKAYDSAKKNINDSYEKIYQKEYDKIQSEYKKVKTKKPRKRKKR